MVATSHSDILLFLYALRWHVFVRYTDVFGERRKLINDSLVVVVVIPGINLLINNCNCVVISKQRAKRFCSSSGPFQTEPFDDVNDRPRPK